MKILVITNYYPPFAKGGYEVSCKDTCDYLIRDNQVVVLSGNYLAENEVDEKTVPVSGMVLRYLRYIDYTTKDYFQKSKVEKYNYKVTSRILSQFNPDIVYIWNQQAISIAPALAVENLGIPKVFDFGDFWYKKYISKDKSKMLKQFVKKLTPSTISGIPKWDNVISVSQWMGNQLESDLKPARIKVIPRGFSPDRIEESNKDKDKLKLIFSGRLDEKKGLHICLKALEILIQKHPSLKFHFDIFGDGDENYVSKCLDLVFDYKLDDYVTFNGRTDSIFKEYAKSHILLMPTMATETFGRVIIEGMAHENVVISSNQYGPAEIIEDGVDGFLINPNDAETMAEYIDLLNRDVDKRNLLAQNAKLKVLEKYNLETINKQREDILKEEVINHA